MESKFIKLLQSASLLLFTISTVVFIAFTTFDYSYFVGWTAGVFAALVGHLTINYAFRVLSKDKKSAVAYAMLRQVLNFILQGLLFGAVIWINWELNTKSTGPAYALWPINVITYLAGFTASHFTVLFNFTIKKGL